MENKTSEQIIQVSAPPTPIQVTPHQKDITKQKIIKWLTFDTKNWEDVFFSTVTHLCVPIFATSVLVGSEELAKLLIIPYIIAVVVIVSVSVWVIHQYPEMQALVWVRVVIIAMGIALGGIA
jgi:hypothetical protein